MLFVAVLMQCGKPEPTEKALAETHDVSKAFQLGPGCGRGADEKAYFGEQPVSESLYYKGHAGSIADASGARVHCCSSSSLNCGHWAVTAAGEAESLDPVHGVRCCGLALQETGTWRRALSAALSNG